MAKSLRDQLVASGLASASQAKKAEKQVRAETQARDKAAKNTGTTGDEKSRAAKVESDAKKRARQIQANKARRDRELAQTRNTKYAERAMRAEIKQLITQHDQRDAASRDDDVAYNFLHKKKIKRIYVPPLQVEQLSQGKLVIVNNDGRYHLVSKEIAAKIAERDPKWIIAAHSDQAADEEDDFYKDFKVPDDLDW